MHALNNALGFHFFDADDLQKAANIYMLEDGYDMNDSVDAHVRADGWYSSEVLAMALRSTAMQKKNRVCWQLQLAPLRDRQRLQESVGALQNRWNSHWVALRCLGDAIYELDSLLPAPKEICEAELRDMLQTHPTYCIVEI